MSPLFALALLLTPAAGTFAASIGWLVRARRAERIVARLGAIVEDSELPAHAGHPVKVRGRLEGGELATGFAGSVRSIEEPHVRAKSVAAPPHPMLRVGGREITLVGPVQVVLGSVEREEREGADVVSVRRVRPGDTVIAEGLLRAVSATEAEGNYRQRAASFEVVPVPDEAWSARPIALYGVRRARKGAAWAVLVGSICVEVAAIAGPFRHTFTPVPPAVASAPLATGRPDCAREIDRLLDANDPWAAQARTDSCSDDQARAEVAWMLGDVDAAAAAFRKARVADAGRPVTMSEVEAVAMNDVRAGAEMVRRMKGDWYKGPLDTSQAQIDCIATRLDSVANGKPTFSDVCLSAHWQRNYYGQTRRSIHSLPAYALHEPSKYFRFQPIAGDDHTYGVSCGSAFPSLERLIGLDCTANLGVVRALFAAVSGDDERLAAELGRIDSLAAELAWLQKHPPALTVPKDFGESMDQARDQFRSELDEASFDAERVLAVAAAAAWTGHDDMHVGRYLPLAEAHAQGILREHLDLVAGHLAAPDPSHSPSDYSDLDVQIFALADTASPEELVAAMKERSFSSPPRLAAILSSRPRHREAFAAWVRGGFVKTCRTCGLYSLLDTTFRRREAARLAGEHELEARLAVITRKLGAALLREPSFGPVTSLESLLAQ